MKMKSDIFSQLKSNDNNVIPTGGADVLTILFYIFLVLKLAGLVEWSWWFVFAPVLIKLGIIVILLSVILPFIIKK